MEEEVRPILVQSTKGISYFSSLHSVVYFQNVNIDRVDEAGDDRFLQHLLTPRLNGFLICVGLSSFLIRWRRIFFLETL